MITANTHSSAPTSPIQVPSLMGDLSELTKLRPEHELGPKHDQVLLAVANNIEQARIFTSELFDAYTKLRNLRAIECIPDDVMNKAILNPEYTETVTLVSLRRSTGVSPDILDSYLGGLCRAGFVKFVVYEVKLPGLESVRPGYQLTDQGKLRIAELVSSGGASPQNNQRDTDSAPADKSGA